MTYKRQIKFTDATYEMLLEMFRILPDVEHIALNSLLDWVDGKDATLAWFDRASVDAPRGWRFYSRHQGMRWAGQ